MTVRSSSFRSKKHRSKRIKHNFYKYGGIGLGILSIFFSFVFLARADFLKVKVVEIRGNDLIAQSSIQEIANQELQKHMLWFFPNNNFFLFPRKVTEEKIQKQFATVANVSVSFDGLSKLLVDVTEYKPEFLWCDSLIRERCYFMDRRGYIFAESADFSTGVLFTYYGLVDANEPIGKTYLPEDTFKELNSFIDSLKLLKMTPVGLNSLGADDFEIYLTNGGKIIFSSHEPFLTTFENLETVVVEQQKLYPDFLTRLEYVDVRFSSKVFVKLK